MKTPKTVQCNRCGEDFLVQEMEELDDKMYCSDCMDKMDAAFDALPWEEIDEENII